MLARRGAAQEPVLKNRSGTGVEEPVRNRPEAGLDMYSV